MSKYRLITSMFIDEEGNGKEKFAIEKNDYGYDDNGEWTLIWRPYPSGRFHNKWYDSEEEAVKKVEVFLQQDAYQQRFIYL